MPDVIISLKAEIFVVTWIVKSKIVTLKYDVFNVFDPSEAYQTIPDLNRKISLCGSVFYSLYTLTKYSFALEKSHSFILF